MMETEPLRTRTDKSRLASQSAALAERFRRSVEAGAQMGKTAATRPPLRGAAANIQSPPSPTRNRAPASMHFDREDECLISHCSLFFAKEKTHSDELCPYSNCSVKRLPVQRPTTHRVDRTYIRSYNFRPLKQRKRVTALPQVGAALRSRGETSCNHPSATRRYPAFSIIRAR